MNHLDMPITRSAYMNKQNPFKISTHLIVCVLLSFVLVSEPFFAFAQIRYDLILTSKTGEWITPVGEQDDGRLPSYLIQTMYGQEAQIDLDGDGKIDQIVYSGDDFEVRLSAARGNRFERMDIVVRERNSKKEIIAYLSPAADKYQIWSYQERPYEIHYSKEDGVICRFQTLGRFDPAGWRRVARGLTLGTLARDPSFIRLVDTSCQAKGTVSKALADLLVTEGEKSTSNQLFSCSMERTSEKIKELSSNALIKLLGDIGRSREKPLITCQKLPEGSKARYVDGKEGQIEVSPAFLARASQSELTDTLYHEVHHPIAGGDDELNVRLLESCCGTGVRKEESEAACQFLDSDQYRDFQAFGLAPLAAKDAFASEEARAAFETKINAKISRAREQLKCRDAKSLSEDCRNKILKEIDGFQTEVHKQYCTTQADSCQSTHDQCSLRKQICNQLTKSLSQVREENTHACVQTGASVACLFDQKTISMSKGPKSLIILSDTNTSVDEGRKRARTPRIGGTTSPAKNVKPIARPADFHLQTDTPDRDSNPSYGGSSMPVTGPSEPVRVIEIGNDGAVSSAVPVHNKEINLDNPRAVEQVIADRRGIVRSVGEFATNMVRDVGKVFIPSAQAGTNDLRSANDRTAVRSNRRSDDWGDDGQHILRVGRLDSNGPILRSSSGQELSIRFPALPGNDTNTSVPTMLGDNGGATGPVDMKTSQAGKPPKDQRPSSRFPASVETGQPSAQSPTATVAGESGGGGHTKSSVLPVQRDPAAIVASSGRNEDVKPDPGILRLRLIRSENPKSLVRTADFQGHLASNKIRIVDEDGSVRYGYMKSDPREIWELSSIIEEANREKNRSRKNGKNRK